MKTPWSLFLLQFVTTCGSASLFGCATDPLLSRSNSPLLAPWEVKDYHPGPGAEKYTYKNCPDPGPVVRDLDFHFFYGDKSMSVVDPAKMKAFNDSQRVIQNYAKKVEFAANTYLYQKNEAGALCAASLLANWSRGSGLLGTLSKDPKDRFGIMQSGFVRKWVLAELALSYLKIRMAPGLAEEDRKAILLWFRRLVTEVQADYLKPDALKNNHAQWAGISVMVSAIALNDRTLFEWAAQKYREGADQIQSDGTLPRELARKTEALHYHHWTLTGLSILARFAEANGLDLWAYRDHRIDLLISLLEPMLEHPEEFKQLNGEAPSFDFMGEDQAWTEIVYGKTHTEVLRHYLEKKRQVGDYWFDRDMTALLGSSP